MGQILVLYWCQIKAIVSRIEVTFTFAYHSVTAMYVPIMYIKRVSMMYLFYTASLTNTYLGARKVVLCALAKAYGSCFAPTSHKLLTSF